MNAAARLVRESTLTTRHFVIGLELSKQYWLIFSLTSLVLISAISFIYVTHTSRLLYADLQQEMQMQTKLQVMRSQLLIEGSTLLLEAKTQEIAEKKLGMHVPDMKSVTVVRE